MSSRTEYQRLSTFTAMSSSHAPQHATPRAAVRRGHGTHRRGPSRLRALVATISPIRWSSGSGRDPADQLLDLISLGSSTTMVWAPSRYVRALSGLVVVGAHDRLLSQVEVGDDGLEK